MDGSVDCSCGDCVVDSGCSVLRERDGDGSVFGITAAQWCSEREMGKVDAALESGADIDAQDEFGRTALHYAAEGGHPQTTRDILARGADKSIQDRKGYTALDLALENEHEATAEALGGVSGGE